MWLINARTLKLEYFIGSNIPEYAILSHTWEDEEVSFQDMAHRSAAAKKGYAKIKETCTRALRHGLEYAWVDTCCINKESSAELTESINSMFQWYQNAATCYAYFSDLRPDVHVQDGLPKCRWFTRGWTLQELIAPEEIWFYNRNWENIGSKEKFADLISSITGINLNLLRGKHHPEYYSVATRMSWAANRNTTRTEDLAYCLMGIFGVNMPMIYGEGSKAFRRLQEEIIKHDNDLTIFAWDRWQNQAIPWSLFSPSPAGFANADINVYNRSTVDPVFSITNKGLRIDNFTVFKTAVQKDNSDVRITRYCLPLGVTHNRGTGIYLELAKVGPNIFVRDGSLLSKADPLPSDPIPKFYIYLSNLEDFEFRRYSLARAVHFTLNEQLTIQRVKPESHWDETRQLCFSPLYSEGFILAALCQVTTDTLNLEVIVCLRFSDGVPVCKIFRRTEHNPLFALLFDSKRADNLTWHDGEKEYPMITGFDNKLQVFDGAATFAISMHMSPNRGVVPGISTSKIYSLTMDIQENLDSIMPLLSSKGLPPRSMPTDRRLESRPKDRRPRDGHDRRPPSPNSNRRYR